MEDRDLIDEAHRYFSTRHRPKCIDMFLSSPSGGEADCRWRQAAIDPDDECRRCQLSGQRVRYATPFEPMFLRFEELLAMEHIGIGIDMTSLGAREIEMLMTVRVAKARVENEQREERSRSHRERKRG